MRMPRHVLHRNGGWLRGSASGSAACLVGSAYHIIRVANWRWLISAREKPRIGAVTVLRHGTSISLTTHGEVACRG